MGRCKYNSPAAVCKRSECRECNTCESKTGNNDPLTAKQPRIFNATWIVKHREMLSCARIGRNLGRHHNRPRAVVACVRDVRVHVRPSVLDYRIDLHNSVCGFVASKLPHREHSKNKTANTDRDHRETNAVMNGWTCHSR